MFPSTIVLKPSRSEQMKTLLLRNPTNSDWIVKLASSSKRIAFERNTCIVEAHKMVKINATFVSKDPMRMEVFAKPVTETNVAELMNWLNVKEEKKCHRAFKLTCCVSSKKWSAQMIILDLPGNAVGFELEDVTTAPDGPPINVVKTSPNEMRPVVKKPEEETCGFLRKFMDVVYPKTEARYEIVHEK